MDVKPVHGVVFEKALILQDALRAAFAREDAKPRARADKDVIFNAPFQMLIAAQEAIDDKQAALEKGVGETVDMRA